MQVAIDITNELNKIKNAIYGREVRGAIHDGINKIRQAVDDNTITADEAKNLVESIQEQVDVLVVSGDSSVEAAQARVDIDNHTYDTLKQRLDAEYRRLTSQLAETDYLRSKESMVNRKQRKPMIWWIDDDGRKGVYTKLKTLAQEYGISFTSAIITKNWNKDPNKYLTPAEIKELSDDYGFEFISHTHNHDPNHRPYQMTDEELHEDFSTSQKILRDNGLNYRGVVFPFGASSGEERIKNIARQYFDFAVGTGASGPTEDNSGPAQVPPIDMYYIRRTTVERGFDIIKKQIDAARDNNGLVVVVSHVDNTGSHDWWDEQYARQVIEYALSQGLEFVTSEKALAAHGNIAQFKDTVISPDGIIFSDEIGKVKFSGTGVTPNTPITDFDVDKITISRITSSNSEGFPDDSGGILETQRHFGSEHYSYQVFTSSRAKKVSMRIWNPNKGTDGNWEEWEYINISRYLGLNAMTPTSSPYSTSRQRLITYTTINSQGNQGFPENKSGLLINYAFQSGGFCFQEYHIYKENKMYKRQWIDNEWSDWELIQYKQNAKVIGVNTISSAQKAIDYDVGITITYFTATGDRSGLPIEVPGTLITYKADVGNGRCYQEFKRYNHFDKFVRYANSEGEWSSWRKYVMEEVD